MSDVKDKSETLRKLLRERGINVATGFSTTQNKISVYGLTGITEDEEKQIPKEYEGCMVDYRFIGLPMYTM